jgi:regulator of sigma D
MLTKTSNPIEQWGTVDKLIKHWLKERQELIVLYCKVDGLKEFTPQDTPIAVKVQALCQVLIDYVSAGHFEIYDRLMREAEEFNDDYQDLISRVIPEIEKSTTLALEFNDRYATVEQCEKSMKTLARDLNALGLVMVERFELEDQLIAALHDCHRELVA